MNESIVVVGLGQLGGVFAHAFLRLGHPVVPVRREDELAEIAAHVPSPALVLVAVGEADLPPVLAAIPAEWRDRVALLQNELLPRDWETHNISAPTVAVVWFEKKGGKPVTVIRPTLVAGPRAGILVEALQTLEIEAERIPDEALVDALVAKNLYILGANLVGLACDGGKVGELWKHEQGCWLAVTDDVFDLQEALVGKKLDRATLRAELEQSILADPQHAAKGRTAPTRLARAIEHASALDLELPELKRLADKHLVDH